MRLWKGVPAHLNGWTVLVQFPSGRFARGSAAGPASAAESNFTTQSVAGQQRISLYGLPDSPGRCAPDGSKRHTSRSCRDAIHARCSRGVINSKAAGIAPMAELPAISSNTGRDGCRRSFEG